MLKQKFTLQVGSDIFVRLTTSLTGIFVARMVGPQVFGTVAFGMAYVDLFGFYLGFFGPSHLKMVSEGRDLGDCISTFSRLQLLFMAAVTILVTVMVCVQKFILGIPFESNIHLWVIFISLLHFVIMQVFNIPQLTFLAKTEQAKYNLSLVLKALVHNGLRILVVILGFKALALAVTRLTALLVVLPITYFLFKKYPRGSWNNSLARSYFSISLPVFLVVFVERQAINLGKVMLQFFTSSQEVGMVWAGYGLASLLFLFSASAGTLFFPLFSKAISENNYHRVKDMTGKYERFIFIHVIPVILFIALYRRTIMGVLLGEGYLGASDLLLVLAGAAFFQVWSRPYGNILMGLSLFKKAAFLNGVKLCIFVGVSAVLMMPGYLGLGGLGLSLGLLAGNLFISIVYCIISYRRCGIHTLGWNYRYLIHGVISFFTWSWLYRLGVSLGLSFWIWLFPLLFFGGHYVSLFLLNWFSKEDMQQIAGLLNLKKLSGYIRGEFKK